MPSRFERANAIRALAMDAVQKANSGHPGAPMGMADIAEVLWHDHMKHNPANPKWADRDRFVLSNGHGSMLLYALLHLTGYDLTIEDLKQFRQLHSKTAGHPEYGYAPGVETTTGPLGQGLANAVGMAIAEKTLAEHFNRPGYDIVGHNTYVFLGDGCLMEGVSHEVSSLAGTLGLGKLIAFYDDNGISIDGEVDGWFTDDTAKRFEAYGWHVVPAVDGHKPEEIEAAIALAKQHDDRPTLIICKTIIGFGSPNKQGKEDCHGAALGEEEVALARKALNWPHAPFEIPADIKAEWDAHRYGDHQESSWQQRFDDYKAAYPELGAEFERRVIRGDLPEQFAAQADQLIQDIAAKGEKVATRKASLNVLNQYGPQLSELLGGSADLAPSNLTFWKGAKAISADDADGNYLHYGVREFGMAAIMNGIALHGGFIPYGATFLIFMEYARNAVRMAALMKQQTIYVFTHDSIGLGEDGPTHQPIEQLASLRGTPNMSVWRPADAVETAVAWKAAIERRDGPTSLIFSRQGLPHLARDTEQLANIARGAWIARDCEGEPEAILIATGSEVSLALAAAEQLAAQGKQIRVVSMPSADVFEQQDAEYRQQVLPAEVGTRVAIEASHKDWWYKYVGLEGAVIGMDSFGESAPADQLFEAFGFTVENVVNTTAELLESLDD